MDESKVAGESKVTEHAERLKERIYVTFTALAVVIALDAHGEANAGQALTTLLITVLGTLLAVFIADVLARMTVHERVLSRDELRRVLGVTLGSIGAVALPVIFLGVGALGLWADDAALRASVIALVVGLIVTGLLAVRRARLRWWQRIVALAALGVVAVVVLFLELLAHG